MVNQKGLAWITILVIAVVIMGGVALVHKYWEPNEAPTGWKTFTDATVTFQYPEALTTTYITPVDWPPKAQVLAQPFTCTEAGSEIAPAGKTEKRMVNNRTYCVTKESEGAAGSIYTTYAYAVPKNNKVVIFTFSLRFVQCPNYDEPQKTACENERSSFDIDGLIDRMAQTLK